MNRINTSQPKKFVAEDKKLLIGLTDILDAVILSQLVDPTYRLMKQAILSKDYDGFAKIDPCINSFWNTAAIVDGCIVIDDRIAIPSCLQRAVITRLHRWHPRQEAIVDASQYNWWPRINRHQLNVQGMQGVHPI